MAYPYSWDLVEIRIAIENASVYPCHLCRSGGVSSQFDTRLGVNVLRGAEAWHFPPHQETTLLLRPPFQRVRFLWSPSCAPKNCNDDHRVRRIMKGKIARS